MFFKGRNQECGIKYGYYVIPGIELSQGKGFNQSLKAGILLASKWMNPQHLPSGKNFMLQLIISSLTNDP